MNKEEIEQKIDRFFKWKEEHHKETGYFTLPKEEKSFLVNLFLSIIEEKYILRRVLEKYVISWQSGEPADTILGYITQYLSNK